jgi:hypothetical protein
MLHFPYWNAHVYKSHDFVEEVERWNIRWALADGKPERLLETLHATNPDLNTRYIQHHQYLLTMQVSSATSMGSFSALRRVKSYLRSTMNDERLSNLSLMHIHRHVQVDLVMIIDDFVSRRNRRLDFS